KKISETDSDLVLISLQKVIKCDTYGLCLTDKHDKYNEINQKYYNTELLKLFDFLCKKTWQEINNLRHNINYGFEIVKIDKLRNLRQNVYTTFNDLNQKTMYIFRFKDYRACGYRKNSTFYLVCIDYDYTLYEHGK
ncbi:hypothetical protein UXV77_001192, partial [Campylobacter jejuni]|nr:hypothetical protein [Campylobacter jejuni]